jgi:CBS domain-containing protein
MTVKHLLEQKGQNLWTIDPDATVLDALAQMAEKDIGSLVVMDGEEVWSAGVPVCRVRKAIAHRFSGADDSRRRRICFCRRGIFTFWIHRTGR